MSTFANVYTGAAANDGTGTPLRNAFQLINQNFANLATFANANVIVFSSGNANVTAYYNAGVSSVAGRTGNVQLYVNDVYGAASTAYVLAQGTAANVAIATLQTQVYANANVAGYLPTYAGNISTANIHLTGNTGYPTNTSTIKAWARVTVGSTAYWTPLYQ